MFSKLRLIIRIVLIVLPIAGLAFLVNKNFVLSGEISSAYDFSLPSPFISLLRPAGGVLKIEQEQSGDYWQRMVIDPVYFDLYAPVRFKKAQFVFFYKAPEGRTIKVGPQIFGEGWNYWLEELKCEKKLGEWCVGKLEFDLSKAFYKDKKIKFMISSPGLDKSGQEIGFTEIRVKLFK